MGAVEYLADRKRARTRLGRVLVLGLGVSGKAAAEYCLGLLGDRVDALAVAAGAPNDDSLAWAEAARAAGAVVLFDHEDIEGAYDLCIASPGISQFSPFYASAEAASAEVISEVEFAWRESAAASRWVAVTGTNGKTTTTALATHLLRVAGLDAVAVGNIGDPCIKAVAAARAEVYVAEVSSYQLASTRDFAPDVAVVLNITPDHLAWHRSHEHYAQAKWKVLANMGAVPGATAVLVACDEAVRARIREVRAAGGFPFAYVPVGAAAGVGGDMRAACGAANAAFRGAGGRLTVALDGTVSELVSVDDLQITGEHNQANALVALRAFLPARPIVLLGGRDKGTDLAPLVAACEEHAKAVVCFGEARERFAAAFADAALPVFGAPALEAALAAALAAAEPGDVVVLSPACASFDEFSCFEERGDVFKALVAARAAAEEG